MHELHLEQDHNVIKLPSTFPCLIVFVAPETQVQHLLVNVRHPGINKQSIHCTYKKQDVKLGQSCGAVKQAPQSKWGFTFKLFVLEHCPVLQGETVHIS